MNSSENMGEGGGKPSIGGVREWLLDNFYIIEERTKHFRQELRSREMRRISKRISRMTREMVAEQDGSISGEVIVRKFRRENLFDDEIWAIPTALGVSLIERIADIIKIQKKTLESMDLASNLGVNSMELRCAELAVSIGRAISTLRGLPNLNMVQVFGEISNVERILSQDPSGVYGRMTEESKEYYRKRVRDIAKKHKISPFDVAREAVDRAKRVTNFTSSVRKNHVGYYLVTTELGETYGRAKGAKRWVYTFGTIFACVALTAVGTAYINWNNKLIGAILLLAPISDVVLNAANYIVTKCAKPSFIPRLDFSKSGIPAEFMTVVVIPAMVSDAGRGCEHLEDLETYYLANFHDNLKFVLICDFPESMASDVRKRTEAALQRKTGELNKKYGKDKFGLFVRQISWERKRGALLEFSRQVKESAKYIITLDSDTRLGRGRATELIGAMAHPLNRPKINIKRGRVVRGYGIMQPRITTSVTSANRSLFSKVFAGQGGIDAYAGAISDIYQDLFSEGIFTGKGIFDVRTFLEIIPNAIRENTVLSHDLLEGCFLRCALIGDVTLTDSFPSRYSAYMARMHRWIRGDWQLIPFLSRRFKLNGVSRWKIIDNMRRSCVAISLSGMLLYHFSTLPLVLLTLCAQLLISTIEWAFGRGYSRCGQRLHSTIIYGLKGVIYQTAFLLLTLPQTAYTALDAIIRTLWRVFVSHEKLLEWTTAADSERSMVSNLKAEYRRMIPGVIFGLVILIAANGMLNAAFLMGIMWICAPIITHKVSRAIPDLHPPKSEADTHILRQLARRTWQYYEDFIGKDTHWLAPDNYQENPPNGVAMRTSPTNIGMQLAAIISAYDFGFVSKRRVLELVGNVVDTVEKLEKWNGNLYNWYSLEDLHPLRPRYISSVDSGNFVGYVMTVAEGLRDFAQEDGHVEVMKEGFRDVLKLAGLAEFIYEDDLNKVEKALETNFSVWRKAVLVQLEDLRRELADAEKSAGNKKGKGENECKKNAEELIKRLEKIAKDTNLAVLYDSEPELFSIGYNAEQQELTKSYYDLLASEARQTVYIAVARGEAPYKAWKRLGRALVSRDGYRGLISWTGSMFEYLMPLLIMGNIENTLLDEAYHFAIRAQRKYGKMRNTQGEATGKILWGTSESGFNSFDMDLNYQYKAFGVPDLGISRGILSEVVIAPYASTMALMVDYEAAMVNLKNMNEEGFCGTYGLYEAVDFTPRRVLANQRYSVVKSYMVHHLGMTFLAINNTLHDNILQRRFGRIPIIRSAAELLEERVPTNVIISKENKQSIVPIKHESYNPQEVRREFFGRAAELPHEPQMHVLSNGKASYVLDHNGNGFLKNKDILLSNKYIGNYIYIKNCETGKIFSASPAPCFDEESEYAITFASDMAEWIRNGADGLDVSTVDFVSSDNALVRTMLIANNSDRSVPLEVTAYSEIVLAREESHYAHMAFSKLFVKGEAEKDSILFTRRPREEDERAQTAMAICKMFVDDTELLPEIEATRCSFLERKGKYSAPAAVVREDSPFECKTRQIGIDEGAAPSLMLDPAAVFRFKVELPSESSARLMWVLGACAGKEAALAIREKYEDMGKISAAREIATFRNQIEGKILDVTVQAQQLAFEWLPRIIFSRGERTRKFRTGAGQEGLWAYGVSGDFPIILHVVDNVDMSQVRILLETHKFLMFKGVKLDLIFIFEDEGDYMQPIANTLRAEVEKNALNERVYLISGAALSDEDRELIFEAGWEV
ncbi:MAG: hypothetical protein LBL34_04845 [Clostridiales bacterium]|nr:hypothetical protein [Clostridiales bacterium]